MSEAADKRVLAIGDIHGCLTALETLAERVPFDPERDFLVTLGDHVDRGPDSKGVIDWLLAWPGGMANVRGNHEIMMADGRGDGKWANGWMRFGGAETLESYGPGATIADVPEAHWRFIDSLVPYFETDTHVFVHANLDPVIELQYQTDDELYWRPYYNPSPHKSGKTMICGHTSQKDGLPNRNEHSICIDTWVYGEGWLTCLDVARGVCWQANQPGEFRAIMLDPA